jgi:hypothetical protein
VSRDARKTFGLAELATNVLSSPEERPEDTAARVLAVLTRTGLRATGRSL